MDKIMKQKVGFMLYARTEPTALRAVVTVTVKQDCPLY